MNLLLVINAIGFVLAILPFFAGLPPQSLTIVLAVLNVAICLHYKRYPG